MFDESKMSVLQGDEESTQARDGALVDNVPIQAC